MVTRAAFTLIELIFAIVIIAIVFLSLPSLSSTNSDAVDTTLVQEAIFPMSARLSQILSYRWDDHSESNATANDSVARVVDVAGGNAALGRTGATDFRIGHIRSGERQYHRSFHPSSAQIAFNAKGIGFDGADDIDDFDTNGTVNLYTASNDIEGYKKNYLIDINVNYFTDTLAGFKFTQNITAASNMKIITIILDIPLADGTFDTNAVLLRSYAANIGEVEFFSKAY